MLLNPPIVHGLLKCDNGLDSLLFGDKAVAAQGKYRLPVAPFLSPYVNNEVWRVTAEPARLRY